MIIIIKGDYKLEIEKLKTLIKVIEEGNFTRAAEKLGYTQSSVSQAVQTVEEWLGLPMVIRGKRESMINPCAKELLPYIRDIIGAEAALHHAASKISGLEKGRLNIACLTSISVHWLPNLLKEYSKMHPGINIALQDGNYEEIEEWVYEGEVDLGFLSELEHSKIDIYPLKEEKLLAVFPENHPMAERKKISIHELTEEAFIMPGEGLDFDLGRLITNSKVKMNVKYSAQEDYVTLALVKNGLGFTILPELMLLKYNEGVKVVELKETESRRLCLGYRNSDKCSPAAKDFISFIINKFK